MKAVHRPPPEPRLPARHDLLLWAKSIRDDVADYGGEELSLDQATKIIRAAYDAANIAYIHRVQVFPSRGGQVKEPVMLAVFFAIQETLNEEYYADVEELFNKYVRDEAFVEAKKEKFRRFAPFAKFTNSGMASDAPPLKDVWDADAALFEISLRAIGLEELCTLDRYESVLHAVHAFKNKVNGGHHHRKHSAT